MENLSKMTIDDSSTSMYFSFNSTTTNKTIEAMESVAEMSCATDEQEAEQNITLEADKKYDAEEQVQTVKKLPFGNSPMRTIPKNILKVYKAFSSTPTKAQLLRSVEITRGSKAVDVCDLGLAFLEAPQECINAVLSEEKENQPHESQETYSETSSEIVISVIEKTQEEVKPICKKVGFSNLPVLKGPGNSNFCNISKIRRSVLGCEPDLCSNRPSRIATKRMSVATKDMNQQGKEFTVDKTPKMINSILKISKELPTKRKSLANPEKPFNLIGKATRMSIVKTTLNSPARKASRKSITSAQVGKKTMQCVALTQKRKSVIPDGIGALKKSVVCSVTRKTTLPTSAISPKKRIIPLKSRKSVLSEKFNTSTLIPTRRISTVSQPSTSSTQELLNARTRFDKTKIEPISLKEEFVCEVCCGKFRVLSLFEAHKRSHSTTATFNKSNKSGKVNQCRYCDKIFAISKALANHLIENCIKIPPADKKKIMFPSFQPPQTFPQFHPKMPPKSISNVSSSGSLSLNRTQISNIPLDGNSEIGDVSMPPPSIHKMRKTLAHSGVYCTPNKEIPCHVCKMSFSNILAYTEHSLSHSTASNNNEFVSTITESTQVVPSDSAQILQDDDVSSRN